MDPLALGLGRALLGLIEALGKHEIMAFVKNQEIVDLKAQLAKASATQVEDVKALTALQIENAQLKVRVEELSVQRDAAMKEASALRGV